MTNEAMLKAFNASHMAYASMFRVLLHQFVLTGATAQDRAKIHQHIYENVMRDLNGASVDAMTKRDAAAVVASMFGAETSSTKN